MRNVLVRKIDARLTNSHVKLLVEEEIGQALCVQFVCRILPKPLLQLQGNVGILFRSVFKGIRRKDEHPQSFWGIHSFCNIPRQAVTPLLAIRSLSLIIYYPLLHPAFHLLDCCLVLGFYFFYLLILWAGLCNFKGILICRRKIGEVHNQSILVFDHNV